VAGARCLIAAIVVSVAAGSPEAVQGNVKSLIEQLKKGRRGPLSDDLADARRRAAEKLGRMGPRAAEAVAELVASMRRDMDPGVRFRATVALGRIGAAARSAVPDLEEATHDVNWGVRRAVAEALERIGQPPPATRPDSGAGSPRRWVPTQEYPDGIVAEAERHSRRHSAKPWAFEGAPARVFTNRAGRYRVTWIRKDPLRNSYWYAWYEFKGKKIFYFGGSVGPSDLASPDIRDAPRWNISPGGAPVPSSRSGPSTRAASGRKAGSQVPVTRGPGGTREVAACRNMRPLGAPERLLPVGE
jgi:hypothetical protein